MIRRRHLRRPVGHGWTARALRCYRRDAVGRGFTAGYGARLAADWAQASTRDAILAGMWTTYVALDTAGRRAALRAVGLADDALPVPVRYLAYGMPLGLTQRAMEVWQSYDTLTTRN